MNWNRKLSELETRALCCYVLDEKNGCRVVAEKTDSTFMGGEGLKQTLYSFNAYDESYEYVFIARQKGYIIDALHISSDEIEEFKTFWDQGLLTPYGHLKTEEKSK